MEKLSRKMKKVCTILVAVLFLVSLTVAASSAESYHDHKLNHDYLGEYDHHHHHNNDDNYNNDDNNHHHHHHNNDDNYNNDDNNHHHHHHNNDDNNNDDDCWVWSPTKDKYVNVC